MTHSYRRICIIGPSSSGKSTLAQKLGQKLNYPVLHMDKIAHIPGTKWKRCPLEETIKKHDAFIEKPCWIVEGNYGKMMPKRLERADLVIVHRFNRFGCLYRFIRRSLKKDDNRAGMLEGGIETIKWSMIKYILFTAPYKNKKHIDRLKDYPHLTVLNVYSFKDIDFIEKNIS